MIIQIQASLNTIETKLVRSKNSDWMKTLEFSTKESSQDQLFKRNLTLIIQFLSSMWIYQVKEE